MFSALLLALLLQPPAAQSPDFSSSIYLDGACWVSRVTASDLAIAPRWRESEDNAPLPPRTAIAAARPVLRDLVGRSDDWELDQLSLRRMGPQPDVWIYEVRFISPLPPIPPDSVSSAVRSQVPLLVLMDGRAIRPVRGVSAGGDCRIAKRP